jgi:H+-transporting ATPase
MPDHALPAVLDGLTADEAGRRLVQFGPNAMSDPAEPAWRRIAATFWAPVPWLLEAAVLLQLVLGSYLGAAVIACLLVFNAVLGVVQEGRAQATLAALKSRLAMTATVKRNASWTILPATALVPGDVIKLSLGGVVPADVRLLDGAVLLDQSMLTGESVSVEAGAPLHTFAGALIRRGEATAEVTATGPRTKFGRTADLVRSAKVVSSEQKAVFRVVRNLVLFNGVAAIFLVGYAAVLGLPAAEIIGLALTALLASIPVALPATFTLAAALGASVLTRHGVLPTRLSAVNEAAMIDVLCADKTGTLTQNELALSHVQPMDGFSKGDVLRLAALASSEGGQDPIDAAIRTAAGIGNGARLDFVPFDPATKMSEATISAPGGATHRVVKGAFDVVSALASPKPGIEATVKALEEQGYRVLAVAAGEPATLSLVGLVALSDPPREDSAGLIAELRALGVRTVMVTGDAPATAGAVARAVGLEGAICPPGPIPDTIWPETFSVFAGVLPEGKYQLVKLFQRGGHAVGMCGDGANDSPALRQAQMGIAVSTATEIAKAAAGLVLTGSGLQGVVAAVKEGRTTFQRILTYTLYLIVKKVAMVLFLIVGVLMTGQAVLTPSLMVIVMLTNDFLSMALTTDHVGPSPAPNVWHMGQLTFAGVIAGLCLLGFCAAVLAIGHSELDLDIAPLRTLAFIALVFGSQSMLYAVRQRHRFWGDRPSSWLLLSSVADIAIASILALGGVGMTRLPVPLVGGVLAAACAFLLVINLLKLPLFGRLRIA